MTADQRTCTAIEHQDDEVAAYLRVHPGFLARRPELFASLHPPVRVHGAELADHMAAMIQAARAHAAEMAARSELVLTSCRAGARTAERVQEAVLAAIQATDIFDCVTEIWPGLLGVDAASLCCEAARPRWRRLPEGTVTTLLRDRPMVVRDRPADAPLLHAEAALLAERDILLGLPGLPSALLALVSRDASSLPNNSGWIFLARVLSAMMQGADDRQNPVLQAFA